MLALCCIVLYLLFISRAFNVTLRIVCERGTKGCQNADRYGALHSSSLELQRRGVEFKRVWIESKRNPMRMRQKSRTKESLSDSTGSLTSSYDGQLAPRICPAKSSLEANPNDSRFKQK